jgi:PAS domain S-box-containing protein
MGFPGGAMRVVHETDLPEAILDAVGLAILAVDLEGHVVHWNRAAAAITGISVNAIRGHVFHEAVLVPGEVEHWKREFDRVSAGLKPRYFESRWKSHDGSTLTLTCLCAAIHDTAEKIQYIVCTVIDSFSRELMTDRALELRDISRFLHDTISQDLVALSFHVSRLDTPPDVQRRTRADSALELIDRCCRDIRVISYMLAPPALYETTLEASIELYAGYVREETGVSIAVDVDAVPGTASPNAQLLLFAAVQAWVARGIRNHPKPKISIRLRNRGAGIFLEMEMICVAPPLSPHAGWAIVRERARALGGEFHIDGDATHVSLRISLPDQANHEQG